VLATAFVILVQTGLVVALLIHRRRRRLAELQVKESEERLLATAASANVGLWQLDRETGELWMTEYCRNMFCLPSEVPLTLAGLMTTIHPEDKKRAISALDVRADPQGPANADVRIRAP